MSKFQKAQKKKAKLRLGITGPSGSGKTYSALRLAYGFGGKIAVIDTEKGSASLYADRFDFDVLELQPPYAPERYIEAMNDAIKEGYEIIIMDSISHAWAGQGGLLNRKEQLDARGGNSFANWAKMTPVQERFIADLINCPAHIIVTMRSKQEHVQIQENGKTKIQKVGLAPIQRDGFEYELTTVFDVAINHEAETSKDRTGLFVDKIFQVTEKTGELLREWLDSGAEEKKIIVNNSDSSHEIGDELPPPIMPDNEYKLAEPSPKDYERMKKIQEEVKENKTPPVEEPKPNIEQSNQQEPMPNPQPEEPKKIRNFAAGELAIAPQFATLHNFKFVKNVPEKNAKAYILKAKDWAESSKKPMPEAMIEMISALESFWGI